MFLKLEDMDLTTHYMVTRLKNKVDLLEQRVARLEAARCEPGETDSIITYLDLQEIDETIVKENKGEETT